MKDYIPLILGMMAVTYLPRLLPFFMLHGKSLPPAIKRFLGIVPYTALSALILRGILEADAGMLLATSLGILASGIASWFKGGLILSVIASIAVSFVILWI